MSIRKPGAKKSAVSGGSSRIKTVFRRTLQLIFSLLLIGFGGILFNLDRLDDAGTFLLKYKHLVPSPFSRFLPGASAAIGSAVPEEELQGRIIEVHDGDTATLLAEAANKKYRIRFYGIDAPELAQRGGTASRDALRDKILNQIVTVKVVSTDQYQRAVGKVQLLSRDINLEMVSEGHAWYYAAYAPQEYDFASAEKEAKRRRLGLWSKENPQPPWEYRRSQRK